METLLESNPRPVCPATPPPSLNSESTDRTVARWAEGFPLACGPMSLREAAADCLKWHEAHWKQMASRGANTDEKKPT